MHADHQQHLLSRTRAGMQKTTIPHYVTTVFDNVAGEWHPPSAVTSLGYGVRLLWQSTDLPSATTANTIMEKFFLSYNLKHSVGIPLDNF